MEGGLINEDYTDYTKAFVLFNKGKALVNGGSYVEGMDHLGSLIILLAVMEPIT